MKYLLALIFASSLSGCALFGDGMILITSAQGLRTWYDGENGLASACAGGTPSPYWDLRKEYIAKQGMISEIIHGPQYDDLETPYATTIMAPTTPTPAP